LKQYHDAGQKLLVSAYGAAEWPTSQGNSWLLISGVDPVTSCTNLAKFVLDNNLDGVDVDWVAVFD
jgi:hypothetical protein